MKDAIPSLGFGAGAIAPINNASPICEMALPERFEFLDGNVRKKCRVARRPTTPREARPDDRLRCHPPRLLIESCSQWRLRFANPPYEPHDTFSNRLISP
jgi:hypothetical protein